MLNRLILDASPTILLAMVARTDLLTRQARTVAIPAEVEREVRASGRDDDPAVRLLNTAGWLDRLQPLTAETLAGDPEVLGVGERSVLGWCSVTAGAIAVLDDRAARASAGRLAIPFVGCVGLVQRAKLTGLIPSARPILAELRSAGLYVSDGVYAAALRAIGE